MNNKQIINDKKQRKLLKLIQHLYPLGTVLEINGDYISFSEDQRFTHTNYTTTESHFALVIKNPQIFNGISYHGIYIETLINDSIERIILISPRYFEFNKKILNKEIYQMKQKFKIIG